MSPIKSKDIESALKKKGFRADMKSHRMLFLYADDRRTSVRTMISHGIREYGDRLLAQVAKQLRIDKAELRRLIECPMTGDEYLGLLVERQHVRLQRQD